MAFDFPAAPVNGQTYTLNGVSYVYNGYAWMAADAALAAAPVLSGRNKIINGNIQINQRGVASTTGAGAYLADRWSNASSVTNASLAISTNGVVSRQGPNHLSMVTGTVLSPISPATAYAGMRQRIEGYDAADLKWGTVDAKPLTLSWRAYSSVASIYSIAISNADSTRTYVTPVSYAAGIYDYTVTIPGCTDGVWNTTNGIGVQIMFIFACGSTYTAPVASVWNTTNYIAAPGQSNGLDTLNRSFGVADVQAEAGPVATPFEFHSMADELTRCQRYFEVGNVNIIASAHAAGFFVGGFIAFNTTKRGGAATVVTLGTASENVGITGAPSFTTYTNGFRIHVNSAAAGNVYYTNTFSANVEL